MRLIRKGLSDFFLRTLMIASVRGASISSPLRLILFREIKGDTFKTRYIDNFLTYREFIGEMPFSCPNSSVPCFFP